MVNCTESESPRAAKLDFESLSKKWGSILVLHMMPIIARHATRQRIYKLYLNQSGKPSSSSVSTAVSIRTEPSCAWIAARGTL